MTTLKSKDLTSIGWENMVYIIDYEQAVLCHRSSDTLNVIGSLPLNDFSDLIPRKSISTPILPRNCIQVKQGAKPDLYLMCLEFAPRVMGIKYASYHAAYIDPELTKTAKGPWAFELALPYLQFYIYVNGSHGQFSVRDFRVSISNKSCRDDPNTPIYYFPMPNLYLTGGVCWGTNSLPVQTSYAAAAEYAVNLFFNSPFNCHFAPKGTIPAELSLKEKICVDYIPAYLKNWENKFSTNPLGILEVKWLAQFNHGTGQPKTDTFKEMSDYIVNKN